jgi:hypothetical protein
LEGRGNFWQTSGTSGREIAKLWLQSMPLFEIDVGVHANTLVMPALDPGIHPTSQQVLSRKAGLPGIGERKRRRPSDGYARQ